MGRVSTNAPIQQLLSVKNHMKPIFTFALLSFATALSAFAQTNETETPTSSTYRLPTVTVYGASQDSTQAVTQVANAVTVLSGEQVRPGSISNTRELGTYLPNVTVFDANNDRSPKFSIRGLRENNFATGDPAVGFYVDDVPYLDLNSRGLSLFDVEQIEFLRGPQPGLFGANGPGGVINIVTRQPGDVWEGRGGVSYGNYEQQIYDVSLRGPLVEEKLSLGISGLYSERNGFVHNRANGNHPDDKETLAGRAQLRWTPAETLDFSLILHGQKFNDGFIPTYYRANDKNLFSVNRDYDGFVDTETWGSAFKGSFANDVVKVTSITSYREWQQELRQDFDFSPNPVRIGFANPDLEQWSQELRVQSNDEEKQFKWLTGLFYADGNVKNNSGSDELAFDPLLGLPPPSTFRTVSDVDSKTLAAFGQGTYTVAEKLDLTAGLRFTYDDRSADRLHTLENAFIPPAGSQTLGAWDASDHFTDISPKFGLSYRCQPEVETYASVSRGYQSGGFNTSNDLEAQAKFDSSHSWNYEAGVKTRWLDDRLMVNGAIFYTDTENYQVYRISGFDPSQAFIVNADRVQSFGAELDLMTQPCANLDISAAFGLTETEFESFTERTTIMTPGGPLTTTTTFDGKDVNFVPEFTANFAAQFRFPCNTYARIEYQAVGSYYLDEGNSVKQGTYGLVNARVGFQHEHFEIYAFGRNLFDKHYVNNALDLRNAFQPDLLIRQPGDPRTFGVALSANF